MISCLCDEEVCYITARSGSGIPAAPLHTTNFMVPRACETWFQMAASTEYGLRHSGKAAGKSC